MQEVRTGGEKEGVVTRQVRQVCVYCASSRKTGRVYLDAAERLGRLLARRGIAVVCGGGSTGCMGSLADGALAAGGRVIGVLPRFMEEREWAHPGLTELRLVEDLHARKRIMAQEADAFVALPGGSGTLEELIEAISWKRLGLYAHPIVMVNVGNFFDPLVELLERSIRERFMDDSHRTMWSVVDRPEDVLGAIQEAPGRGGEGRESASP